MTELKSNEELDAISVTLQDDAAVFFSRRKLLSNDESKNALQTIVNILKN